MVLSRKCQAFPGGGRDLLFSLEDVEPFVSVCACKERGEGGDWAGGEVDASMEVVSWGWAWASGVFWEHSTEQ